MALIILGVVSSSTSLRYQSTLKACHLFATILKQFQRILDLATPSFSSRSISSRFVAINVILYSKKVTSRGVCQNRMLESSTVLVTVRTMPLRAVASDFHFLSASARDVVFVGILKRPEQGTNALSRGLSAHQY
ncbi:hypothetical protein BT63DRAFT_107859 [Microthyrium microscopicum]|uniref:Uncharacterized protein n=1 Tax=Microthyrium microscopicum TaxID=703497 RepID=A0A6A6TZH8_9PEZI|nr:hypothetical protein BT63DRAFT_107859 [Microthyrium microscopicum]